MGVGGNGKGMGHVSSKEKSKDLGGHKALGVVRLRIHERTF